MSKKVFSEKEIKILASNKFVKSVSEKGITYSDEFKRLFITEHEKRKLPRQIFEENGFDVEILGQERVRSAAKRWRAAYKKQGISGLTDTRKESSGRPRDKELSLEEKYKRLEAQNNLLKAENELLKKLEMMEKGMGKKK